MLKTAGIHHITAYVHDVQACVDFYAGLLGLRLVKQTVHFDAPEVGHFYFGNEAGHPGTLVSFLFRKDLPAGRLGGGQVGVIVYAVPEGGLLYWRQRLKKYDIPFMETRRFGKDYVRFTDEAGLLIDLVELEPGAAAGARGSGEGPIPERYAIQGIDGVLLFSRQPERTAEVLENSLGLAYKGSEEGLVRFEAHGPRGSRIDMNVEPMPAGSPGAGVVQHLAWRTPDASEQILWQEQLKEGGLDPTPAINMEYYKTVKFREPGGILFQVATDAPGFLRDETAGQLGRELMLPDRLEPDRTSIERNFPAFRVRELG
ncbi:VOC family protein [Paenibacillus pinistramenti]|uniref:VOC family protein n=1 Tax=Paenibacillus pinistramenti TaxID=1768003 RepID=UPI0011091433|nr:VOC family protein [Paenibacillus pinistramenti]